MVSKLFIVNSVQKGVGFANTYFSNET